MNTEEQARRKFLENPSPKTIEIMDAIGASAGRKVPEAQLKSEIRASREQVQASRKARGKRQKI